MTDLLLEWASYRSSGRRDDLPEELLDGEQPVWVLADLAALGHIDLLSDGRWRTAPPVLAAISNDTGLAVSAILCGARTPQIMKRFRDACGRAAGTMAETVQPKRPTAVMVTTRSPADLAAIAADAGFLFQRDAAFTILACLPTIQNWPRSPCPMVVGRVQDVKRFSRSRLAWVPSSLEAAVAARRGFFRIHRDWDWISLLKQGVGAQAEIDAYAGRIAAAERAKKVSWDPALRTLRLPSALYPPMLIARALVLCSGTLPARDRESRTITFGGVPARTARLTLALTRLRFE